MKNLIYIQLIGIFCFMATIAHAQKSPFPFFRSFLDGNLDGIAKIQPNDPGVTVKFSRENKMKVTNDGLVLTTGLGEVGAFTVKDLFFTTEDGILIEFEYIMKYNTPNDNKQTDGIVMFLVDATDHKYTGNDGSKVLYGAAGSGFGFTGKTSLYYFNNSKYRLYEPQIHGMPGGYLAVALDQGPFKNLRMEGEEMRSGLEYSLSSENSYKKDKYDTSSNITIRGAGGNYERTFVSGGNNRTMQAWMWGYPLLATRYTGASDVWLELNHKDNADQKKRRGFMLERENIKEDEIIKKPFHISGNAYFTTPGDPNYRKAIIALDPNTNNNGFKITVTIQHGEEKTVVIKDFEYPRNIYYNENSIISSVNSAGGDLYNVNNSIYAQITDMTIETPTQLVVGFAASTGSETSHTNIIKNLRITPFNAANSANDDILSHRRGPVTVKPLENDWGYKKVGNKYEQSKDYLDLGSFRFWKDEYHCEGDNNFTVSIPDQGKWVYNSDLGQAMFFPNEGFRGTAKIMYDINGNQPDYSEPQFRSSLATISVTIADN